MNNAVYPNPPCRLLKRLMVFATVIALWLGVSPSARALSALEQGFRHPPDAARPWVYWFWLNGNITREGVTADLEAMKRVGIGGVLIMEVDQGSPAGPVDFMGPRWRELFKHVVAEAQRLGLEVNMNNDAGWNGSGGPWIKPEQSMQKIVWTEKDLEGPRHFEGDLAQPEKTAGLYHEVAVLAFPATGPYRIENVKIKACYEVGPSGPPAAANLPPEMVIDRARIVDLSSRLDKNGHLVWDMPPGKWTVVRFGRTSTGGWNGPSPKSGQGLEPDKLSKEGIEASFAGMMAKLVADIGSASGKPLISTHIDSWENGAQNWTGRMGEEFRQRRGYDPLPYLPAMMGRVVGSLEISERFLWDLRQTISELVVENYAGHMRTLANQHGLRFSVEAYGGPCDDLSYAGRADEPMCEFWVTDYMRQTCKEMASAAHTYGKPILGCEAFTAWPTERWCEHPGSLKTIGDQAFCTGVNRLVFHRYAMQPWAAASAALSAGLSVAEASTLPAAAVRPPAGGDRRPGMTMGPYGTHYERTQTWWEDSATWHEYLSRCQYLLREGRFVADLCYLQPETAPQGVYVHPLNKYDYDNCGAEVVLTRMTAKDGRIVLPDGMSYRLLVLPDTPTMTPALLARIKELVEAGATVVGQPPVKSPSLSGYPTCDDQVKRLAQELWADCDGKVVTEHHLGQGRVVWGVSPEQILAQAGVQPDFVGQAGLHYIHRSSGDAEIYFVANPEPAEVKAVCSFRVSGKRPELWSPDTGGIEPAAIFNQKDGRTDILLTLEPSGSVFVIFRETSTRIDPVVEVKRDGKSILSAIDPGSRLVVDKAVYGALDDPRRTRDVRGKIQQMADAGQRSLRVDSLVADGDPVFGTVKTLVVEYHIANRQGMITGRDLETVYLTHDVRHIVVSKAAYGVLNDPKRTRDVRAKVQHLVDLGERSFVVSRMAEGDDPAYRMVKTLSVECTVNGQPLKITGTDPDTIRFTSPELAERIAEIHVSMPPLAVGPVPTVPVTDQAADAAGHMRLMAWEPGRYELTTASGKRMELNVTQLPRPLEIAGPWAVRFTPGWGRAGEDHARQVDFVERTQQLGRQVLLRHRNLPHDVQRSRGDDRQGSAAGPGLGQSPGDGRDQTEWPRSRCPLETAISCRYLEVCQRGAKRP